MYFVKYEKSMFFYANCRKKKIAPTSRIETCIYIFIDYECIVFNERVYLSRVIYWSSSVPMRVLTDYESVCVAFLITLISNAWWHCHVLKTTTIIYVRTTIAWHYDATSKLALLQYMYTITLGNYSLKIRMCCIYCFILQVFFPFREIINCIFFTLSLLLYFSSGYAWSFWPWLYIQLIFHTFGLENLHRTMTIVFPLPRLSSLY